MNRRHAVLVALVLGAAAAFGAFAATRTANLGAASRKASDARIIAQERQLTAAERALKKALAARPHLPAPATVPATVPAAAPAALPAQAQRVVYVRPAPIIIHKHRAGSEQEGREGSEGGGDD